MGKFWFLVGYSLKKKIKSKAFIISNVIIAILLIFVINLPHIINATKTDKKADIYLIYDNTEKAGTYIDDYKDDEHEYKLATTTFDETKVFDGLKDYDAIIYLSYVEEKIVAKVFVDDLSATNQVIIQNDLNGIKNDIWKASVSEEELSKINAYLENITFTVSYKEESSDAVERNILGVLANIILVPIFILIVFIMAYVSADILEEKSSRSIEYIISNVDPKKHFLSKILGAIFFVIIQLGIMLVAGLIGILISTALGGFSSSITSISSNVNFNLSLENIVSKIPGMIAVTLIFVFAGFIFYLVTMAICSAMATSMEDYQQFQAPVMIMLMIGFYAGLFGAIAGESVFIKVMGYIPFFSPLIAPVLFINGTFSIVEVLISFGVLVVFDVLIIKFGIPLYKASILDYSQGKFFKKLKSIIKRSKYTD